MYKILESDMKKSMGWKYTELKLQQCETRLENEKNDIDHKVSKAI